MPRRPTGGVKVWFYSFFNLCAILGGWLTPRPSQVTPGNNPIPTIQEPGWAPCMVWTGAENLAFTGFRSLNRLLSYQVAITTELSWPTIKTNNTSNRNT